MAKAGEEKFRMNSFTSNNQYYQHEKEKEGMEMREEDHEVENEIDRNNCTSVRLIF